MNAEAGITDAELIAAVATSKDSDPLPGDYWDRMGWRAMIERLVRLGVMEQPAPTDVIGDVTERARAACRDRLAAS